ncbi:hypothetical protein BM477_07695 [Boudabousia marimammalium]|uniref:VTT domain-containing protein n=2 Tax=Boudabousia marimammalium TaxID=156892 RepID=A0A1Q5PJI6_9ACTO|nr:hypothetical protein BM477_07695 [Boudabousia marimammalium]
MELVLQWSGSFWILPILALFCLIDGFLPILPSESLIIALSSLSHTGRTVPLWSIIIAASLGAFIGDIGAYHVGRWLPVEKIPLIRNFATPERLERARLALNRRGASYLLIARFIPIGRIAVNMTAGASHYARRRYIPTMIFADITWTSFSTLIGLAAGKFLGHHPLLAMVLGVGAGILLGTIVDRLIGLYLDRKGLPVDANPEESPLITNAPSQDEEGAEDEGDAGPTQPLEHSETGSSGKTANKTPE